MRRCCSRQRHALCWVMDADCLTLSSNMVPRSAVGTAAIVCALGCKWARCAAGEAARRLEFLERHWRVHGRWSRIRDGDRRHGAWRAGLTASPLDQCAGEPGVRMPGNRSRLGLQLGGQQSDEPPHAWSNDPASDSPGEAIYLRDEETGEVWTPTPLPGDRAQRSPFATVKVTRATRMSVIA